MPVSARLLDNYDDYYADGQSEWRRLGAIDKANNIVRLCAAVSHESIIDIGAGEGSVLARLSEVGFGRRMTALEISASGVETIKHRNLPELVECRRFDGYTLPYADGSFDLGVLSHVIEHVEHPRLLLYEAARVSKCLFVEVPLEDTVRMSENFVADKVGHINFFSLKTIRRLLQSSNLEILDQLISNPRKEVYSHRKGRRGMIECLVKDGILLLGAPLATKLFSYHASLLCRNRDVRPS